ncbi:hypothetical protein KU406_23860, partial [Salmonella enterica subsp. enterica serovar Montevideo]|nr:hypothetical protein [Salmonella enterica subsp. enterica serovar Montevideo]
GEVSMAQPLGKHAAALAFAGMWRIDEAEAAARLQALKALNQRDATARIPAGAAAPHAAPDYATAPE